MVKEVRNFAFFLALVGTVFGVLLATHAGDSTQIHFLDLRVVNDTRRTVTVQPCWDFYCLDTLGLSAHVLKPGRSVHERDEFSTDIGKKIVVAIRKPGGKRWQFSACMITTFAPGQPSAVVRVSDARPCVSPP